MQIAPNFDSSKWNALQLDDPESTDWEIAVTTLDSRIRARYLEPVDLLIDSEKNKPPHQCRFGFTVLGIDCLLVETLGAFLLGLENTDKCSSKTFCTFLTTRKGFSDVFDEALAKSFYSDFRCGILHQAETGRNSKVWSIGRLITEIDGGIVVNRNEFHERLKKEFSLYIQELLDPANIKLRSNFRQKMDYIARGGT